MEIVTTIPSPQLAAEQSPWFDFIATMTQALAWPLLLLIVFFLLRNHIVAALKNMKTFKWGDAEATFDSGLREAKQTANTVEPPPEDAPAAPAARVVQLTEMAVTSPTGAIIEAWKGIMESMAYLLQRSFIAPPTSTRTNAISLINLIKQHGLLPSQEMNLLMDLRGLRNEAAHGGDGITVAQAQDYVRLADRLINAMDAITVVEVGPTDPLNE